MTRTDTGPHADEQDPTRCIAWDDPTAESDQYCPHCEDQLDEYDTADTNAPWPRRGTKHTRRTQPARAGRATDRGTEGAAPPLPPSRRPALAGPACLKAAGCLVVRSGPSPHT